MASSPNVEFTPVDGAEEVFTDDFLSLVVHLHGKFSGRVNDARAARLESIDGALRRGRMPGHLDPGPANDADWNVPEVPSGTSETGDRNIGPCVYYPDVHQCAEPGA